MTTIRATLVITLAFLASPCIGADAMRTTLPPLGAVVFTGTSAYAPPQLFPTYSGHLGNTISRDCARAIATSLSDLYVRDGYVRPELTVDDSLAASGVLRVNVFEARVSRVVFEGERGEHGGHMDRIAARLTAAVPLRGDDVAAALRDMRAIPGIEVSASTRRDESVRNAYELVVATSFSRIDGSVRVNNRGTDEVGPAFMLGQVMANDLLGRRERLGVVFAAAADPDEYLGGGLMADVPLGTGGARANLLLFRSRSAPTEEPVELDYRYVRERVVLRATHPLVAATTRTLNLSGGIEADDLAISRDGTRMRDDRLRILEAALRGAMRAAGSMQYSGGLVLRKGLAGLGAGLDATDLVDDPRRADFLLAQLQGTALRRFAGKWTARIDAFAQYSGHVLPDSERFKIGGDRLGRGFEVAEIAGDRGIGGKAELRRDLFDARGFMGRLSTYGFYDIGTAWKRNVPGREAAATTGLGLGMSGAQLTGYVEVAKPLSGPDIEGKRTASVFAELSWRF